MLPRLISIFLLLASISTAAPVRLTLRGDPTVRLTLDQEYGVIEIGRKDGTPIKDLRSYILDAKDDQSSAVLALGSGGRHKTKEMIAKIYEGAKVTMVDGEIAGVKVQWWHYRDSHHLYSTCSVMLRDKRGRQIPAYFDLVANSADRRAALEDAISKIEFL